MEQVTMLKEILHVLKTFSMDMNQKLEQLDKKFEDRFQEMDEKFEKRFQEMDEKFEKRFQEMDEKFEKRFQEMDKRFDRLEAKVDGIRIDLTSVQKTTNFLLEKVASHDDKLLELSQQQK